jgi:hypothetical protein
MKYTNQLVWKACGEFIPDIETFRKSAHIQLPEALKIATVNVFMRITANNSPCFLADDLTPDERFAIFLIKKALVELDNEGQLSFGTVDEYWK